MDRSRRGVMKGRNAGCELSSGEIQNGPVRSKTSKIGRNPDFAIYIDPSLLSTHVGRYVRSRASSI